MPNKMRRKLLLIIIIAAAVSIAGMADYGCRKKVDKVDMKEPETTGISKEPQVLLELDGEWSSDQDNRLRVVVNGVASPSLLVIDFGPVSEDRLAGARPNVPNVTFIEGVPLVRQVQQDGEYIITFHPAAFSLARWFGQGEHELPSWAIVAYLTSGLSMQTLPEAGIKRLGQVRVLEAADLPTELSIVSVFRKTSWVNCISPTQVFFINKSPGGMFIWVSEKQELAKTAIVLDKKLKPVPPVQP